MSNYTHDDAMRDLRVLDGYAFGVKGSEDSNEHVRLAAYIKRIEAENERLRQNQCSKDWCDDALTDDLKALVRHCVDPYRTQSDLNLRLTPRILEWAGVE